MSAVIVAGFMWILVAVLLVFRRRRSRHTVTWAAFFIAFALTLNIDPLYIWFDGLLGGRNWGDLIANLAFILGIFALGRGVTAAYDFSRWLTRFLLGPITLIGALIATTIFFLMIDQDTTSTQFMLDYGAQPAAANYSLAQYVYILLIMLAMGRVCLAQIPQSHGVLRASVTTLVIGSTLGALTALCVIGMDLAHEFGNLDLMYGLGWGYDPLYVGAVGFMCLGLAIPPIVRQARLQLRHRRTRRFSRALDEPWLEATRRRPTATRLGSLSSRQDTPEERLHRQVVEIRDALIDPRAQFTVDEETRLMIAAAEHHLLRAEPVSSSGR